MNLADAPEEVANAIDALSIERVDWALKMHQSRADVFKGRERPGGPASATKTLEDLIKLASRASNACT